MNSKYQKNQSPMKITTSPFDWGILTKNYSGTAAKKTIDKR
jgi:hypothetical protein